MSGPIFTNSHVFYCYIVPLAKFGSLAREIMAHIAYA